MSSKQWQKMQSDGKPGIRNHHIRNTRNGVDH